MDFIKLINVKMPRIVVKETDKSLMVFLKIEVVVCVFLVLFSILFRGQLLLTRNTAVRVKTSFTDIM